MTPFITISDDSTEENGPFDLAVRAVIRHQDDVTLMHLKQSNTYVLPGGGVHEGESLETALTREVTEETGHIVDTATKTLIIREILGGLRREHHIYAVTVKDGTEPTNLTDEERDLGMVPVRVAFQEATRILAKAEGTHKYSEPIQTRELIALLSTT